MKLAACVGRLLAPLLAAGLLLTACSDGSDAPASGSVTLVNLNVLHGFDCASTTADTAQCRVADRIALLREHLIAANCPEIVTLQEVVNADFAPTELGQPLLSIVELITAELPALSAACDFDYYLVYQPLRTVAVAEVDEELMLSRYRVLQVDTRNFYGPLFDTNNGIRVFARHALHARIDHPTGEIDVYTTHLASGSDLGGGACGASCPGECNKAGTVRACQAEQLARYVEQTRAPGNLALISGDFNAPPGSDEYLAMQKRGWLDSHLAAGAPECTDNSPIACTSGRQSTLEAIEDPALNVTRRIDYIFIAFPTLGAACNLAQEGDVTVKPGGAYRLSSAGLFAASPNPFTQTCGSLPNAPCWVSDHSGNRASLVCAP